MKKIYDISDFVIVRTPEAVTSDLVSRIKKRRKEAKVSQKKLATISGVSYGSIRRFESTGEISLTSLLKIANALGFGYLEDFDKLFERQYITSLKDYIPK